MMDEAESLPDVLSYLTQIGLPAGLAPLDDGGHATPEAPPSPAELLQSPPLFEHYSFDDTVMHNASMSTDPTNYAVRGHNEGNSSSRSTLSKPARTKSSPKRVRISRKKKAAD
ncbi:unnamed protein product [Phytophthora lilii]|uniref:Unnamed protein product n=1 Tax=Phytophthora lilii TaxID=2077276 RepID=A0A9W7CQH8_9STRA|nr:unnamed protein product [Phytophthora lilii]